MECEMMLPIDDELEMASCGVLAWLGKWLIFGYTHEHL